MFKKSMITLSVALSIALTPIAANALIPVTDVASIAQTVLNGVQRAADAAVSIQNEVQLIKQSQAQLQTLTGARSLGDIMSNPLLRSYIPQDYQALVSAVQSGNPNQLSSAIAAIKSKETADTLAGNPTDQLLNAGYIAQASSQQALQAQEARLDNVKSLQNQINGVTDSRSAQDLSNRIAIEAVQTQADANRIALMNQVNQQNIDAAKKAQRLAAMQDNLSRPVCNSMHPC
jgi:type IV secretion system protein VirB5